MAKNAESRVFRIFLILILFSQVSNIASAEAPAEQWNRSFGGNDKDNSRCVEQTLDGGYVVAGTTDSYGKGSDGQSDAWLIKLDKNGNIEWNKTYGETYAEWGFLARQTSDGGYVLSGYSFPHGYNQSYLVKTDRNGNEIWSKISEEISHEDYLQYVAERTSDVGYIIGDMVEYEIPDYDKYELFIDTDIRLTKYNISGSQQWNNTFGNKNNSEMVESWSCPVRQTPDCGYIIAGTIDSNKTNFFETNSFDYDIWLIKTDEYGQEQWNKTFGGSNTDAAFSISLTSDEGYVLTGIYDNPNSFGYEDGAFILKTDSKGNQEWIKVFPNCTLYSGQQTSDGGYIAAGVKNGNAWLVKLEGDREGIDCGNGKGVDYKDISDSSFSPIKNHVYDIFPWVFPMKPFK
ncbi:hypothetical protein ACSAZL_05840 [Methanosarcina sp. T3]|uniref:hypothetical protein n=1 Tax=Methanosarcina sp. T3 TaxID=3439062 RepID=UPI003F82E453